MEVVPVSFPEHTAYANRFAAPRVAFKAGSVCTQVCSPGVGEHNTAAAAALRRGLLALVEPGRCMSHQPAAAGAIFRLTLLTLEVARCVHACVCMRACAYRPAGRCACVRVYVCVHACVHVVCVPARVWVRRAHYMGGYQVFTDCTRSDES